MADTKPLTPEEQAELDNASGRFAVLCSMLEEIYKDGWRADLSGILPPHTSPQAREHAKAIESLYVDAEETKRISELTIRRLGPKGLRSLANYIEYGVVDFEQTVVPKS